MRIKPSSSIPATAALRKNPDGRRTPKIPESRPPKVHKWPELFPRSGADKYQAAPGDAHGIEEHLAVRQKTGAFEDSLALHHQFPILRPCIIRCTEKCVPCPGCAFVEQADQLGRRLQRYRLVAAGGEVELRRCQDGQAEAGELSYVGRHP